MIRIALSHNIHDTKSIRKQMQMIWNIFCKQIAMTTLPLPLVFLSSNSDAEAEFTVSKNDGPYSLVIPPLTASQIVRGFRKDIFPTDLKIQLLGILFQELSRRVVVMEYLAKSFSRTEVEKMKKRATEIIFTSTNAEIALLAEDDGPPLEVIKLPASNRIIIIFMYTRHKDTLESKGFFDQLIQQGWIIC